MHCGSDCRRESNYPDMPLVDFLKALDSIDNPSKTFIVVLTGGEPLLRKDIEQCGMEIRKRGVRWSLVSNGILYNRQKHVSLLNAGLGALTISLDGLEDTHNWLRNDNKNYSKVIDAIGIAASSSRLNFDVVTCVNSRNIHQLKDIRDMLVKLGVKAWRLFTIIPIGRAADNPSLFLSDIQLVEVMNFISSERKRKDINVQFSCEGYVGGFEGRVRDSLFFCRAGINIGSVLIDGAISACPNNDRAFVQGNIYTDNFFNIWQTRFQPFRNREWNRVGNCSNCNSYKECNGSGFHNWHGDLNNPLVCHHQMLERAK
jgi:radical SAM enzyme (rSAM/lipoprotein system)